MARRGGRVGTGRARGERGQAVLLLVGVLGVVLVGAFVLGAIARGVGVQGRDQRAADLGALAGARAMRAVYYRLFEPATIRGRRNPRHLEKAEYLRIGRDAALLTARRNDAREAHVSFPDGREMAPVRIRVTVSDPARFSIGDRRFEAPVRARAEAELAPPGGGLAAFASGGGYSGPLAYRQGKPMRPDVALAFDRMAAAAARDGKAAGDDQRDRSDAEQAVLVRPPPRPALGGAAGAVAAPLRDRARMPSDAGEPSIRGGLAGKQVQGQHRRGDCVSSSAGMCPAPAKAPAPRAERRCRCGGV